MVVGCWLLVVGRWSLVIGWRLSVGGRWLMVAGYRFRGLFGRQYRAKPPNCVSAIFHSSLFTLHFSLKNCDSSLFTKKKESATVSAALPADIPQSTKTSKNTKRK